MSRILHKRNIDVNRRAYYTHLQAIAAKSIVSGESRNFSLSLYFVSTSSAVSLLLGHFLLLLFANQLLLSRLGSPQGFFFLARSRLPGSQSISSSSFPRLSLVHSLDLARTLLLFLLLKLLPLPPPLPPLLSTSGDKCTRIYAILCTLGSL